MNIDNSDYKLFQKNYVSGKKQLLFLSFAADVHTPVSAILKLKNEKYKSCVAEFLERENYPFEKNSKEGFNPMKSNLSIMRKLYIKSKKLLERISLIN